MKNKKIPLRSCIITKEKLPKQELIRIVKNKDNIIFIDESGKSNGRGAYIKKDINVIEKAEKNKILDRVFEIKVADDIYEKLKIITNNN